MARILLVIVALAITIYAIADWISRSRSWTPGRVNRWVWLAVIVLIPFIGPLAWIITGVVTRAEQGKIDQRSTPPARSARPDDDPEAISDLADRLARRQKRSRPNRLDVPTDPQTRETVEDEDDPGDADPQRGPLTEGPQ